MFQIGAIVLELVFVVFFFLLSFRDPEDVRFYPQTLLVLMGLCALVSLHYAWRLRKHEKMDRGKFWLKTLAIGLFSLYLMAFNSVGFLLATFLFYFLWMCAMEKRFSFRNLLVSIVFVAAIFYIFHSVLGVLLPTGWLENALRLVA